MCCHRHTRFNCHKHTKYYSRATMHHRPMHKATTWFSLGKNSNLLSVWFCPLKTQVSVNFGKKNTKRVSDFPFLHEESSRGCSLPTQLKLYHRLIGFHMWVCEFTLLLTYSVSIQSKCGYMTVVQIL